MKNLPYLCKRDIFCVFRNIVIGFVIWFFAMNFIMWCDYSGTSFMTPYNEYNPYGVFIQKYCHGDSTNKEQAFQKYVGSKAYFDDMRDYGIELEKTPVLFFDIQCLKADSSNIAGGEYIPYWELEFRDTQHLCNVAGIDYSKWEKYMRNSCDFYLEWDKDSDEELLARMRFCHVELRRELLNTRVLRRSLHVQELLRDNYCWWDIVSTRNPAFKVNYKWLLSLFDK